MKRASAHGWLFALRAAGYAFERGAIPFTVYGYVWWRAHCAAVALKERA